MGAVTAVGFGIKVILPYARTGVPPADWSGTTIAIAVAVLVGLYAYLGTTVYQRFATVVSANGVSIPTMRGRRLVSWVEVQRVGIRGHEVLLDTAAGKVVINVFCFVDSKALTDYLQLHLQRASQERDGAV